MDSQPRRKGASIVDTKASRVQKLVARSETLDQQLSDVGKSNEEQAATLRAHLCEVLSDIIISNPGLASERDCMGKLWRSCFYGPIAVWRKKIAREKRKGSAKLLEQNFKKFLGEALTLYEYLVIQYQSKLVPSQSQGNSQGTSQGSAGDDSVSSSTEGVVPGLCQLFIYMGDLHRYAESFNKAETYYLNASKLAPGMGNPYNQLAVVSQLKDPNQACISLYWYCRSLFATHGSFPTSTSNLERLFDQNRTYLREHSRDPHPPVFESGKKKISTDLQRAQKAGATKACLAHFVDLHFEFFKNSTLNTSEERNLQEKMAGVMKSFESLLNVSAFGDSLLLKIVIICTSSVDRNKRDEISPFSHIPLRFALDLAEVLAEKVSVGIAKIREKSGKQATSIRYLLPLHVLLTYLSRENIKHCEPHLLTFWEKLAGLATTMHKMYRAGSTSCQIDSCEMKEFQILKGYKPYSFLDPSYLDQEPYVAAVDAVDVLDLLPTQSQASSKQAPRDDILTRVSCFLGVCDFCVERRDIPILFRNDGYVYEKLDESAASQATFVADTIFEKSANSFIHDAQILQTDEDGDDAGDVIVNMGGADALISNRHQRHDLNSFEHASSPECNLPAQPHVERSESTLIQAPQIAMKPPPGFEGTNAATARPTPYPLPSYSENSMPPAGLFTMSAEAVERTNEQAYDSLFPTSKQFHFFPMQGEVFSNSGQPVDLFGSLSYTQNPFASATDVAFANASLLAGPSPVLPVEEGLLSTDLLESLWMDDAAAVKTKNPFAQ